MFDQIYQDECPEHALTEGAPATGSANNMNVEATPQPITLKSKPKNFSNFKGLKNYVNDQTQLN